MAPTEGRFARPERQWDGSGMAKFWISKCMWHYCGTKKENVCKISNNV